MNRRTTNFHNSDATPRHLGVADYRDFDFDVPRWRAKQLELYTQKRTWRVKKIDVIALLCLGGILAALKFFIG